MAADIKLINLNSGSRPSVPAMPRGIEVLVKKASVDRAFRELLLEERGAASAAIGLELSTTEIAVLNSLPRVQIEQVVDHTPVPDEHRRVLLGKIAAAMLAVLSLPLSASAWEFTLTGISYKRVGGSRGPIHTVRVPHQHQRLNIEIADRGTDAVTVKVKYDCPFESGEVTIICGHGRGPEGTAVTCRPERMTASKGAGEAAFSVEGKGGATQSILVQLRSTIDQCERRSFGLMTQKGLGKALLSDQPGEYQVAGLEDCAIYKVVEFHKVWPS
jgi:hypothetical protein